MYRSNWWPPIRWAVGRRRRVCRSQFVHHPYGVIAFSRPLRSPCPTWRTRCSKREASPSSVVVVAPATGAAIVPVFVVFVVTAALTVAAAAVTVAVGLVLSFCSRWLCRGRWRRRRRRPLRSSFVYRNSRRVGLVGVVVVAAVAVAMVVYRRCDVATVYFPATKRQMIIQNFWNKSLLVFRTLEIVSACIEYNMRKSTRKVWRVPLNFSPPQWHHRGTQWGEDWLYLRRKKRRG